MTTGLLDAVRQGFLGAGVPAELVDELLAAFSEAKRRFYRDDHRPQAVEGGRFAEAAFRVLQWQTTGSFTAVGKSLPRVDQLLVTLENAQGQDSVRVHIPRTLRLIYDIRNKRDAAHLADGIDPNLQDATLVIRNMDWVLAEFVRLYNNVSAQEAHGTIIDLVSKEVPAIQEFNGFPRLLKDLKASEHILVLVYRAGADGLDFAQLSQWVKPSMRTNLRRTAGTLATKHFVHIDGERVYITRAGEVAVEASKVLDPA